MAILFNKAVRNLSNYFFLTSIRIGYQRNPLFIPDYVPHFMLDTEGGAAEKQ